MPESTSAKVPASPATAAVGGDHDRVVMASRKADGTPDQTPDFEYIGERETTLRATKEQLREQAVSAADVAERGVTAGNEADTSKLPSTGPQSDPSIAAIADKHRAAADAAEKAAEAEVDARFTKDADLKTSGSAATSKSPAGKTESSADKD